MSYRYLKNWKNERVLNSLDHNSRLSIVDDHPLTDRLMNKEGHNFKVQVLKQRSLYNKSSSKVNMAKKNEIGIYRSVLLSTAHYPCIQAYTFMPERHIHGKDRFLRILGSRSLGTYILKTKRFKKQEVVYKIISDLVHRIVTYKNGKKVIYVNEIFPKDFRLEKTSILNARGQL